MKARNYDTKRGFHCGSSMVLPILSMDVCALSMDNMILS